VPTSSEPDDHDLWSDYLPSKVLAGAVRASVATQSGVRLVTCAVCKHSDRAVCAACHPGRTAANRAEAVQAAGAQAYPLHLAVRFARVFKRRGLRERRGVQRACVRYVCLAAAAAVCFITCKRTLQPSRFHSKGVREVIDEYLLTDMLTNFLGDNIHVSMTGSGISP
jgi:hypothetical protein